MIALADYLMGRDLIYAPPPDLLDNAVELLGRVNPLLDLAAADGAYPAIDAATGTPVASGWRPPAINDRTSNAASGSSHLTMEGIDLREAAARALARWCLRNPDKLAELGLWMEDPQWTPSWVHLQSRPPGSGRRVYVPSAKPPRVARLPEQMAGGAVA